MNTINYIQLLFCCMSSMMVIAGSLINMFEPYMPDFICRSFYYGKFAYNAKPLYGLEVPKAWFRHFYIYSSVVSTAGLVVICRTYLFKIAPPFWLEVILDEIAGYYRVATVSSAHVLLAMILIMMQCLRRLYDTHYVSVFSKDAKINLSHYLIGFIHYTGAVLAIFVEAPYFSPTILKTGLRIADLQTSDYLATALFMWAWVHQYKATVILANLRKNKKGEIISQKYELPRGDWFEYLSSPHSTAEVLMYFSLTVILWNNITWLFIFLWVLTNQVETTLLSHWWYQKTFDEFPSKRKALIPFIY